MRALLRAKVSGAPVLDASGKLVGILSETDILWKEAGSPQVCRVCAACALGCHTRAPPGATLTALRVAASRCVPPARPRSA